MLVTTTRQLRTPCDVQRERYGNRPLNISPLNKSGVGILFALRYSFNLDSFSVPLFRVAIRRWQIIDWRNTAVYMIRYPCTVLEWWISGGSYFERYTSRRSDHDTMQPPTQHALTTVDGHRWTTDREVCRPLESNRSSAGRVFFGTVVRLRRR